MLRFEINVKNMGGCGGGGGGVERSWRRSRERRDSIIESRKEHDEETESDLEREDSASASALAYDMPSIKP